MKALIISLLAIAGLSYTATAQDATHDLDITSKYHINVIIPLGKVRIWPTLTNNSKSDYKDITYKVEFDAADGTPEGSTELTYHDFIGPGVTKKIKEQYIDCPKDCKSIVLSIVSGKKLD